MQKFATSILIIALLCAMPPTASAWGPVGHETVAYIAQDNLTPAARRGVRHLLGKASLASVSNWADQVRMFGKPHTGPWHFIDIPIRVPLTASDMPRFCKNHDCIVDQIEFEVAVLKNTSASKAEKIEALKFLVHFVGDLHQPLHCADDHDRGGNQKIIRFKKKPVSKGTKLKLHALWDRLGQPKTVEHSRELATKLRLTSTQKQMLSTGSVREWAWESFLIAKGIIYAEFQPVMHPSERTRDIIFTQLRRAGARLATLLNEIFGP